MLIAQLSPDDIIISIPSHVKEKLKIPTVPALAQVNLKTFQPFSLCKVQSKHILLQLKYLSEGSTLAQNKPTTRLPQLLFHRFSSGFGLPHLTIYIVAV